MESSTSQQNIRILLVEDNPGDVRMIREHLLESDFHRFEIELAEDLKTCLEFLAANKPDIILLDLGLPDSQQLDTFIRVQSVAPDTPILVLTGLDDSRVGVEAIQAGAQDYLVKSDVNPGLLARVIRFAIERKQGEDRLRQSEARYRGLFEAALNGVAIHQIIVDENGQPVDYVFLDANPAFEAHTGLRVRDILGRRVTEVLPGIEESDLIVIYGQVALSGEPVSFETFFEPLKRHYMITAFQVSQGYFAAIFNDITERKQTENTLRENEKHLRMIADHVEDIVWQLDTNLRFTFVSPAAINVLGYAPQEMLQTPAENLLDEAGVTLMRETIRKRLEHKSEASELTLYKMKHKDGRWIDVEVRSSPIFDREQTLIGFVGITRNITERKRAEEALLESEENYRQLFEMESDAIFLIDNQTGQIVEANHAASLMYGYSHDELLSMKNIDLSAEPEETQRVTRGTPIAVDDLVTIPFRLHRKKDGSVFSVEITGRFFDHGGRPSHIAAIRDITGRRQIEQAFQLMSETQEQLAHLDNLSDIYQLVGENVQKLIGTGQVVVSMLDDRLQAMRIVGLYGFGNLYESLVRRFKIDPTKLIYEIKDMTPEELQIFRSGRLEKFEGGLYAILTKKVPKSICEVIEKQLNIRGIYTMGFVSNDLHFGGITILAKSDISPFTEVIETIMNQAAISVKRIRAEEALRKSEERFRALFENTPVAIWEEDFSGVKKALDKLRDQGVTNFSEYFAANPETVKELATLFKILDVNNAALQMYKAKSKEELIEVGEKILSEGEQDHLHEDMIRIAEGKVGYRWEGADETLTGEPIDILMSWSLVPGYEQDYSRAIVTTIDVSELKRAELALRESEERFRTLFMKSPIGVLIADLENRILDANEAICTMLEFSRDELIGKFFLEITHPEDRESSSSLPTGLSSDSDRGYSMEKRFLKKDGSFLWVLVTTASIKGTDGEFLYNIGMVEDITQRKQTEQSLRQRLNELETLYESGLTLSQLLNPTEIGQRIIDLITNKLDWHHSIIRLYHPEDDSLEILAFHQSGLSTESELKLAEEHFNAKIMKSGDGLSGWAVQNKEIVRSGDVSHDPRYAQTAPNLNSGLYVPMQIGDDVIGVISIESEQPDAFDESDERLLKTLASQAAIALENARLHQQTVQRLNNIQALRQIDRAISSSFSLHPTLTIVIKSAVEQLNVSAADILLYNPLTQTLDFAFGRGFNTSSLQHFRVRLGDGYAGQAALERSIVRVPDLRGRKTDLLRSPSFSLEGFESYFAVPLLAKGEMKGVLEIFNRAKITPDEDWLDFLEAFANQASIAIDNASMFDGLQRANKELMRAYDATIEGWSRAMDLRDEETEGHTLRVTDLTLDLAYLMGISDNEMVHIRRGALLHDIGKLGVPDRILLKPDKLTEEEWGIMRRHPTYAYEMLSPIVYLRPALDIPYCHHEKWDGSGYPRGLMGDGIPLSARVFAVVDVWDAMTSNRPYRPAWPEEKVIEHIRGQSEKHFDPQVVQAFLHMIKSQNNS